MGNKQNVRYVMLADGHLVPVLLKSYRDAVAEAKYRMRVFDDKQIDVIRVKDADIVWSGRKS